MTAAILLRELNEQGHVADRMQGAVRGFENRCREDLVPLFFRLQRIEIVPLQRDADDAQLAEDEKLSDGWIL